MLNIREVVLAYIFSPKDKQKSNFLMKKHNLKFSFFICKNLNLHICPDQHKEMHELRLNLSDCVKLINTLFLKYQVY